MFEKITEIIREYLQVGRYRSPVDWGEENIDFTEDKGADRRKLDFKFSPFLRDPINAWDFTGVKKEVTVVAPEQTGKTLCWIVGLLWSFIFKPCISLVVYKSDDKAEEINSDKLKPLMRRIASLAAELLLPRSSRKDHYNFSNIKSYFLGAGTRITSSSSKIRVADEVDDWQEHEGQVSNLDDLRKRDRSFSESMLYKVCSPKGGGVLNDSAIWEEFLRGSQGYWTLMCLKCGEHTMRSCDTRHLKFEYEDYTLKKGSCRLKCPACGYEHSEDKKEKMNRLGKYIHKHEDRIETLPSFQWGALASQAPAFAWDLVAQAQLDAGSTGDFKKQIYFDNSFRGLPFRKRRRDGKAEVLLRTHSAPLPKDEDLSYRLLSIDTQGLSFWYVVRGYDKKGNSYKLESGQIETWDALGSVCCKEFFGSKCVAGIIDSGGHRAKEVGEFVVPRPAMIMYKGRGQVAYRNWELSKDNKRLVLVNPNQYRIELLYIIHGMEKNKNIANWFLPEDLDADYIEQMLDYKPDTKLRLEKRRIYANWVSTGNDHLFDCEKQLLVLNDMYLKSLKLKARTESQQKK